MAAEFDAAVSALLGGVFAFYGRDATYVPPDDFPAACTVVVNSADDQAQLGQSSFVASRRIVEVRKSEIAAPVRNGEFLVGEDRFRICAAPRIEDPDGLVWTCLCDLL